MADGVGFEPTKGLHPCRFSRPVLLTTQPPILFKAPFVHPKNTHEGQGNKWEEGTQNMNPGLPVASKTKLL